MWTARNGRVIHNVDKWYIHSIRLTLCKKNMVMWKGRPMKTGIDYLVPAPSSHYCEVESCGHVSDAAAHPPGQWLPTALITLPLYLPVGVGGGGGMFQYPVVCLTLTAVNCAWGDREGN